MPSAATDEALIHRIRAGDEDAFGVLFSRYEKGLRAWIRQALPSRLRRKVSTSDLLQETRIVALRRVFEFHTRPDGTFRGWLHKIVRYKVNDAIRNYTRTARRGAVGEVERGARPETGEFVADQPSPSEIAMASELRSRIERTLDALPPDYREVIRLTRLEHHSITEAAHRMGRSPDATRKLYGRALARFAEVYDALAGGESA